MILETVLSTFVGPAANATNRARQYRPRTVGITANRHALTDISFKGRSNEIELKFRKKTNEAKARANRTLSRNERLAPARYVSGWGTMDVGPPELSSPESFWAAAVC